MNKAEILKRFEEAAEVKQRFVTEYADQILLISDSLVRAFQEGHKVLLFGNGGSATDASHLAAEFVGRYHKNRPTLPALALATDIAVLTCISNDFGYDEIFARQIEAHGEKGDLAIAISTSGNSPNVLKGIEIARKKGLLTIGWTGAPGGKLASLVDHAFLVPSTVTARIQECHITLGHVLCEIVEEKLFANVT